MLSQTDGEAENTNEDLNVHKIYDDELLSMNKENGKRAMSFNPNVSDSVSNQTTSRRVAPNWTRPPSEKQSSNKLYQRYRKLYDNEKKETEKLKRLMAQQSSELKKLKSSNGILSD